MSKQRISDIFNKESNLSLNTTEKIAKGLKLPETDLFDPNFQDKIKKKSK
jgi:transcriptional regulator with XRE-family HTH domain